MPRPNSGGTTAAIEYLRRAERLDQNGITIDRTRVLIAGELRVLGNLRGAERTAGAGAGDTKTKRRAPTRWRSARGCASGSSASRGARRSARGRRELRAAQARLRSHRHEFGAGAGAAGRRRPRRRRQRRRHRDRDRDADSREVGESGNARALPVGELRALRGAHRGGPGGGAGRSGGHLACIPHRRDHPRTLAGRSAGARGPRRDCRATSRSERLREMHDRVAGGPRTADRASECR